jgi:hypothetical protein
LLENHFIFRGTQYLGSIAVGNHDIGFPRKDSSCTFYPERVVIYETLGNRPLTSGKKIPNQEKSEGQG